MPLEQEDQRAGPILAPEEIKTIFGSLPDILEVHHKIMVRARKLIYLLLCEKQLFFILSFCDLLYMFHCRLSWKRCCLRGRKINALGMSFFNM